MRSAAATAVAGAPAGRALRGKGFAVDIVVGGEHGVDTALEGRHELIVLDPRMRDVNGLVIPRVRPRQRVLVLSAASEVDVKVRCLELSAANFVAKPFALAELVARVGAIELAQVAGDEELELIARTWRVIEARLSSPDSYHDWLDGLYGFLKLLEPALHCSLANVAGLEVPARGKIATLERDLRFYGHDDASIARLGRAQDLPACDSPERTLGAYEKEIEPLEALRRGVRPRGRRDGHRNCRAGGARHVPADGSMDVSVNLTSRRGPTSSRRGLLVVGLDHTTAPLELRERLAFAGTGIPAALRQLVGAPDPHSALFEQAAILSTCNRVEVYGVTRSGTGREEVARFLSRHHGVEQSRVADSLYTHRGDEVAHHLAATTAGMHSLVLGEAQVQGQARDALELAVAAGTAGPELRRLFEAATAAGRRVRARTALGRGIASVPQAGVELVRQRLGTLEGATVLLIGAGTVSELAAKHLMARGAGELLVLGRDTARARGLAERYGGRALPSHRLEEGLAQADVIISSTGAPQPILRRAHVERALTRRRPGRAPRMLLIDLAVPRDVDPAVTGLPGVEVYTIDDLEQVVAQTIVRRSAELPAAYAILRGEVARFTTWLSSRHTSAELSLLSVEAEAERAGELERTVPQLATLSARDREVLDAMTRRLVQKLLNSTSGRLRDTFAGDRRDPRPQDRGGDRTPDPRNL